MKIEIFMEHFFPNLPRDIQLIIYKEAGGFINNYCISYNICEECIVNSKITNKFFKIYNNLFTHVDNLPKGIHANAGDLVINYSEYSYKHDITKTAIYQVAGFYPIKGRITSYYYITPKLEELNNSYNINNKHQLVYLAFYRVLNLFNDKDIEYKIHQERIYNNNDIFTIHPIHCYKIIKSNIFSILPIDKN